MKKKYEIDFQFQNLATEIVTIFKSKLCIWNFPEKTIIH